MKESRKWVPLSLILCRFVKMDLKTGDSDNDKREIVCVCERETEVKKEKNEREMEKEKTQERRSVWRGHPFRAIDHLKGLSLVALFENHIFPIEYSFFKFPPPLVTLLALVSIRHIACV